MSVNKKCTKCGVNKLLEVFGKRSAAPDGHNPVCKPCVNAKQRARQATDAFKTKRNAKNALPAAKAKKKKADAKRRADPGFIEREKTRTGTAEFKANKSAYQKEYQARPETKELINARNALPENVLKRKAVRSTVEYKEKQAEYNHGYKDTKNERRRERYANDPEYKKHRSESQQTYQSKRSAKDQRNKRSRERYATDPKYRTECNIRSRINYALGKNKGDHALDLLGCTIDFMNAHLEEQFKPGMTWDNQGKGDDKWEIDHIIPFVAFDLTNRDEQFTVCWVQNLQPLWGPDNRSKGGKYTEEGKQSLICKYNEHKK